MTINMEALAESFQILIFGWLGVFLVLSILYVVSLGLQKLFPKEKE